jgi:hypothetical protein
MGYNNKDNKCRSYSEEKNEYIRNHNHEFLSSTDYERDDEGELHNHRIAGVTGPPIKHGKSHIHKINEYTDTFGDHFHAICDTTGPALYLPGGKHIHLVKGTTTIADGHDHDYYFTTLIEDPTNVPEDRKC